MPFVTFSLFKKNAGLFTPMGGSITFSCSLILTCDHGPAFGHFHRKTSEEINTTNVFLAFKFIHVHFNTAFLGGIHWLGLISGDQLHARWYSVTGHHFVPNCVWEGVSSLNMVLWHHGGWARFLFDDQGRNLQSEKAKVSGPLHKRCTVNLALLVKF